MVLSVAFLLLWYPFITWRKKSEDICENSCYEFGNGLPHLRPRHAELPVLPGRQRLPALQIDDLGDGVGDGVAAPAQHGALLGLEVRDRRGLCHAEALAELDHVGGGLLHELLDEGGAEGGGAAGHVAHRGQVGGAHFWVGSQEADQRWDQVQPGGLVLLQTKLQSKSVVNRFRDIEEDIQHPPEAQACRRPARTLAG